MGEWRAGRCFACAHAEHDIGLFVEARDAGRPCIVRDLAIFRIVRRGPG